MIFAPEIRAARALLGWSQLDLAKAASIGVATVRRIEGPGADLRGSVAVAWKIQTALESAGVEFIPADETKGPGVRLQHRTTKRAERAPARKKKE
jgi:transcriptional regulator with XRE-family HTH domain